MLFVVIAIATVLLFSPGKALAGENWLWPVPDWTGRLSRGYSSSHDGQDILQYEGAPIVASRSGTVARVLTPWTVDRNWQGYGYGVVINHGDGYFSHYAHMSGVSVSEGQSVSRGQQIGTMGATGNATGTHLHFAIATSVYGGGGRINNNREVINYDYTNKISDEWSIWTESVTANNAVLHGRISLNTSVQFSQAGVRVWDNAGSLIIDHSEGTTVNFNYMNIWYDVNGELGKALSPGVTYRYQFWCVAQGVMYTSGEDSFTTAPLQSREWSVWEENVTETNAVLHARATMSQTVQFTQVGVTIWDKNNNVIVNHSEGTTVNFNYINIWYDINGELHKSLEAGGTYTYQFWCVAAGNTYYSDKKTFNTPGLPSYTVSFNANGHGSAPAVQEVKSGSCVTMPSDPTADGYTFCGWYMDAACTSAYDFDARVKGPLTLYAKWVVTAIPISDATVEITPATSNYTGKSIVPSVKVTLNGKVLSAGTDYDLSFSNNRDPGVATVIVTGKAKYVDISTAEFSIISPGDGWTDLAGGHKGYVKRGKLVKGWLSIGSSKYWFGDDGVMATGWTDVEVNGKAMHYYFNPRSGNLARGTWMTIGGRKYYFRESGNVAHGWATISDGGVDKKYYFDDSYQMVTGWQEIEVNGKPMRYYFRPAGSMATGWATIDGQKYFFRASGNMATGFTTVTDGSKRYFHEDGTMHVGWLELSGRTYYFRPSGAMQTGTAKIGDFTYEFNGSGVLVREVLSAQAEEQIEVELGHDEEPSGLVALSDDQVDAAEEVGNALEATDDVDTTEKAATPDIVEVTDQDASAPIIEEADAA